VNGGGYVQAHQIGDNAVHLGLGYNMMLDLMREIYEATGKPVEDMLALAEILTEADVKKFEIDDAGEDLTWMKKYYSKSR